MEAILPSNLAVDFTSNWSGPVDGKQIDAESISSYGLFPWKITSTNKWWNRPLKKGEIGCAISHWLCWKLASESLENLFLILEDDVYFTDEIWAKLDDGLSRLNCHDPNWGLLYLGRFPLEVDTPVLEGIVKPGYSHCTFAYILTKLGAEKLLQASFEAAIIPVDEFLPAMYINHPREDVRMRYPKRLSAYAFEPSIVFQLPKGLAGSDTEDSEFWEST